MVPGLRASRVLSPSPLHVSAGRAVGIVGIFICFQVGLMIPIEVYNQVVITLANGRPTDVPVVPMGIRLLLANTLGAYCTLRIELRRQRQPLASLWSFAAPVAAVIGPVLLATMGNAALVNGAQALLLSVFPVPESFAKYSEGVFDIINHPWLTILLIAVAAPLTEELVFRGLILRGLLRRISPAKAIWLSAGLFSAMHMNPWQIPVSLSLGLLTGWIFYRTRSVWLCVFAHAINNMLSIFTAEHYVDAAANGSISTVDDTVLFAPAWLYLLGLTGLVGGVMLTSRWAPRLAPLERWKPTRKPPPLPASPLAKSLGPTVLSSNPASSMSAELADLVTSIAQRARAASYTLAITPSAQKNAALDRLADLLPAARDRLIEANQKDLSQAEANGLTPAQIDRLTLTDTRLEQLSASVREVAALPDPVGETLATWTQPNGLRMEKRRVPIGVIGIIYEARPNVTIDCAVLCLKSGNAAILRGGKEIFHTNTALAALVAEALAAAELPADAVQLIPTTDRAALNTLLKLDELIHCIIPRGGKGLIRFVAENSTIPVIKHYEGVCCVYLDKAADPGMAESITVNSKVQRPGVCNAAEQLVVHADAAATLLPRVAAALVEAGVELRCDEASAAILTTANIAHQAASPEDFSTEFLALTMAVRVVDSLETAIAEINRDSSGHSESIVTSDETAAQRFQAAVDSSAVFWNTSTRFNDGFEFGFGAEIGISTDRLHARGPMGLPELCSYKYIVNGTGQIRS